MNKVIILLALAVFLVGCHSESPRIDSELSRLRIIVVGLPTQKEITLPEELAGPNWGLKNEACSVGGYNLSPYAGKNVIVADYFTKESLSSRLHAVIITEKNKIICVYMYTENTTGGVFSANLARLLYQEEARSLNEEQCLQKSYEWVHVPGLCPNGTGYSCGGRCDIPTSDAGKKCYSNDECEGACLCTLNEKDSEGYLQGQCSRYKFFTEVVDCPCILTTKSNKEKYPFGCA